MRAAGGLLLDDDAVFACIARRLVDGLHCEARLDERMPGIGLGFAGHVHYLTHHVREQGTLRLEEAIRKMTSMPAAHFGLWDRGLLRAGYSADVVVFDWDELDDVSTRENPSVYARGIEHVLVNGVLVVDGAEHTGARPGRHLLRR